MSVKIEGGVTLNPTTGLYEYRYVTKEGEFLVTFTSATIPKIGDTVEGGILTPAVLPQTNQDKTRWLPPDYDTWPYGR